VPLLCGFTGNKGVESVFHAGVGIGTVRTLADSDNFGEFGGDFAFKFRNFPYDDLSGWLQVGASYMTFPDGGALGNQIVTIQLMGGVMKSFGYFGGGFVLTGDTSGIGPMGILPSIKLRVGDHDRVQFGMGMFDQAPYWSSGGVLHFEGIFTVPFEKIWAPKVKVGGRLNPYDAGQRVPIEFAAGIEARLGRHIRVGVDGSLGDGGFGNPPSFTVALIVGGAVGKGTKSDVKPADRNSAMPTR
jgi:hypothetical protein